MTYLMCAGYGVGTDQPSSRVAPLPQNRQLYGSINIIIGIHKPQTTELSITSPTEQAALWQYQL